MKLKAAALHNAEGSPNLVPCIKRCSVVYARGLWDRHRHPGTLPWLQTLDF